MMATLVVKRLKVCFPDNLREPSITHTFEIDDLLDKTNHRCFTMLPRISNVYKQLSKHTEQFLNTMF